MSNKFSLNKRQIIKGFVLAIIGALIPFLSGIINAPDFDIRTICSWDLFNNIIKTSLGAGFGYILVTFFEGRPNNDNNI